jgi:hypothetical protein
VTVDFGGSVGNVRHSLSIEYGDGAIEELPITAEVLRGVFAEPRSIALRSSLPGELVQASVELKSDDGLNFQIDRAQCSIARSVQVNSESASVTLTVLNGNDIWLNTGTLVIGTSHPVVGEIRVPVTTHFSLTWKTDPAAVFVQESTDADVERTISIESLLGLPFVVHARQGEAFEVVPISATAAPSQQARVRIRQPSTPDRPYRQVVTVATTMPDAATISIPVVFYR